MWPAGPYFYLPKMESHLEARLWNDIFCEAQDMLNIPRGTIKVGQLFLGHNPLPYVIVCSACLLVVSTDSLAIGTAPQKPKFTAPDDLV